MNEELEELLIESKQEETSECCDALVVMGFCNNCKEHV